MFFSDESPVQIYTPAFLAQARKNNQRRERERREAEHRVKVEAAEREFAERRAALILAAVEKEIAQAARVLAAAEANYEAAVENRRRMRFTHREIERRACRVFGVTLNGLHGTRRSRDIVFARQFVMYWSARLTVLSYPQIGRLMGGRDHTTCLHGKDAYVDKRKAMGRHLRQAR